MGATVADITSEVGPQHEKLARRAPLVPPWVAFRGILAKFRQSNGTYVQLLDKKYTLYRYSTAT